MAITTKYYEQGIDLGDILLEKAYVIENYPYLLPNLKSAGLWCWGYNNTGQIGDNSGTSRSSPVQTISGGTNWKQVSNYGINSSNFTAAIKTDGTLWTWGWNANGQLGDGTNVSKLSPVQTVAAGTNWKQVATSYFHTAAIKTDGTLNLWGYNISGQLGDRTVIDRSISVQTISGGTNWKQVSCGASNTAAIKMNGTLWVWGGSGYGIIGDGFVALRSSPTQIISGGTNWKYVSIGNNVAAAIKTDGTLWNWGYNTEGQLGDNTTVSRSSPVQTVSGGTNWKYVSAGGYCTAAIKTDGTLWLWGSNVNGVLGGNLVNTTFVSSPIQTISSGTNWKQVSACHSMTSAIKTDGTLWTWGFNDRGQLGDNTTVSRSSPVQTVSGGTNWKQASASSAISDFDEI